ncbi:hypothetical protein [Pseudomonas sp. W5-36]|uniref:hypothetical protein n=1 Tax=Pseudomonas sp. W5-36 TaxID=3097455 RepID=UPI00397B71C3
MMNSKYFSEKADFERFIKSRQFDRRAADVLAKAKLVNGRLPVPSEVNSYNEEESPAIRSVI